MTRVDVCFRKEHPLSPVGDFADCFRMNFNTIDCNLYIASLKTTHSTKLGIKLSPPLQLAARPGHRTLGNLETLSPPDLAMLLLSVELLELSLVVVDYTTLLAAVLSPSPP